MTKLGQFTVASPSWVTKLQRLKKLRNIYLFEKMSADSCHFTWTIFHFYYFVKKNLQLIKRKECLLFLYFDFLSSTLMSTSHTKPLRSNSKHELSSSMRARNSNSVEEKYSTESSPRACRRERSTGLKRERSECKQKSMCVLCQFGCRQLNVRLRQAWQQRFIQAPSADRAMEKVNPQRFATGFFKHLSIRNGE